MPRVLLPIDGAHLIVADVSTKNVGRYDCVDASDDDDVVLFSEDVFVRSRTSLLVPVPEENRLLNVFSGQPATILCLLADPADSGIQLDLIGQVNLFLKNEGFKLRTPGSKAANLTHLPLVHLHYGPLSCFTNLHSGQHY